MIACIFKCKLLNACRKLKAKAGESAAFTYIRAVSSEQDTGVKPENCLFNEVIICVLMIKNSILRCLIAFYV